MLAGNITVNASIVDFSQVEFGNLTRASHDSEIAMVALLTFWNKNNEHILFHCLQATTNCVFAFQMCGTGSELSLRKFSAALSRACHINLQCNLNFNLIT